MARAITARVEAVESVRQRQAQADRREAERLRLQVRRVCLDMQHSEDLLQLGTKDDQHESQMKLLSASQLRQQKDEAHQTRNDVQQQKFQQRPVAGGARTQRKKAPARLSGDQQEVQLESKHAIDVEAVSVKAAEMAAKLEATALGRAERQAADEEAKRCAKREHEQATRLEEEQAASAATKVATTEQKEVIARVEKEADKQEVVAEKMPELEIVLKLEKWFAAQLAKLESDTIFAQKQLAKHGDATTFQRWLRGAVDLKIDAARKRHVQQRVVIAGAPSGRGAAAAALADGGDLYT
eukprot:SAG11_NODE_3497_length_2411_cov_9.322664_1_plen_297_part_00